MHILKDETQVCKKETLAQKFLREKQEAIAKEKLIEEKKLAYMMGDLEKANEIEVEGFEMSQFENMSAEEKLKYWLIKSKMIKEGIKLKRSQEFAPVRIDALDSIKEVNSKLMIIDEQE